MTSNIDTHVNKLESLYAELDKILQENEDIQYTNKKVQNILSDIDAVKRQLANIDTDDIRLIGHKKYPGLQAKQFNIAELTAQYEGVYDIHDIATKLYKQYASSTGEESKDIIGQSVTDKAIADSVWKLTPVQKLLRNFMSTDTPYRGILIVHGTGVGKTCAGVSIAEDLKNFVKQNETKIFVIREDEFKRQMFDINKVAKGKPGFQCTGETYLDAIRKSNPRAKEFVLGCVQGHNDDCKRVERLVTKEIEKYYDFSSINIWAKKIDKLLTSKTKYLTGAEKQKKQVELIRNIFNNSVLIVDEAHNLRNVGAGGAEDDNREGERDFKLNIAILTKVLLYSQNMRLILLSATPMYDKPTDILPLLNFLLLNDKRPEAIERALFDTDNNIKDKDAFLKVIQGYISYVRGNDPMDFPIRLDARVNLDDEDIIDLARYPKRDIYGNTLDMKVKHLTLVNCPMSNEHQAVLLKQINAKPGNDAKDKDAISSEIISAVHDSDKDGGEKVGDDKDDENLALDDELRGFSVAYGMEIGINSFIYRTLEEANGVADTCYGAKGLQAVAKKVPKQMTYTFKDDAYALRFKGDNLKEYGPKMWSCIQNILKSTGPVFVYMTFTASGVIPMAFALEMAGFTRYGGEKELLSSKHKDTSVNRGEYIIYTGDPALSKGAKHFFNLRERMIDETGVKVVLASKVGSEGLNLFGFREIHILDPWHNMNLIEQTIGRVIRYKSHAHLKNPALRNVTVYLYATTLTGKFKDRESIDLHVYAIAESKAIKSGEVEYLLKSAAIDCTITKPLNYRPKELYDKPVMLITSTGKIIPYNLYDEPYSKNTLYMANSDYSCVNPDTKPELPPLKFADVKKYEIELREIIGSIMAILRENMNILESDILFLIADTFQNSKRVGQSVITPDLITELYKYLIDYFETADLVLLDKYGRRARVSIVPITGSKASSPLNNATHAKGVEPSDKGNGSVLRLIPLSYFDTQQPVVMQELRFLSALDMGKKHQKFVSADTKHLTKGASIQQYVTSLRKDKQRLLNKEELDYDSILSKITKIIYYLTTKQMDLPAEEQEKITLYYDTNIKVTFTHGILELYKAIFDKLLFVEKLFVVQNLVYKVKHNELLDSTETNLFSAIRYLLVHESEVFKTHEYALSDADIYSADFRSTPGKLYGFIIAEFQKLILYRYQDTDSADIKEYFIEDKAKATTIINRRRTLMTNQQNNPLFGFILYTKNTTLPPIFKITDYLTRGKKKSVKGVSCNSKQVNELISYMKLLDPTKAIINYPISTKEKKHPVCGDLELLMRMKNNTGIGRTGAYYSPGYIHYFFGPEEYYIWSIDNIL